MTNILVTTDLSANSKAAMRFASQLASQSDCTLTFLHIHHVMRPTVWHEAMYLTYEKNEREKALETLDGFVASFYKQLNIEPPTYTCVVENAVIADKYIMEYAADNDFDFICISTRGAGTFEKLLGTTTANLINQSSVPVIAVPGTFRLTKLASILYASDLTALEAEVPCVADFARLLPATVTMLHITSPNEPVMDPTIIDMAVQKFANYPIAIETRPRDFARPLIDQIEDVIHSAKPSMVILFTSQNQGFFYQLLNLGNVVNFSFLTTVPLLVFAKK